MATYAIGDIQGCYKTLLALLKKIKFDPSADKLWIAGDIVNRGPASLKCLEWARDMGPTVTMVLGNHEIHLLGVAFGVREENPGDTIREILRAKNGGELISWLATQRIVHHEGNRLMVHGGFSPHWTLDQSLDLSTRIEAILRGPRCSEFIGYCYGKDNSPCDQDWPELKSAIRTFTTIRTCSEDGTVNRNFAGPLSELPKGFFPWYQLADPTIARQKVYFGHWAAHGYKQIDNFTCLDSGCVWERELTAVRLADDCPINVKNCDI